MSNCFRLFYCPVSCKTLPPPWVSWYDTKQSDSKVPVMLELWGMRSTPSVPSLPGPLWPGVVAPDRDPIYESNRTKQSTYAKLNCLGHWNCILMLNRIIWNRTVYMYKNGFGSNNLQRLMCYKTKPNQTKLRLFYAKKFEYHIHYTFISIFLCSCFLRFLFSTQSNWVQIILPYIYLTHTWDPNKYCHTRSGCNGNKGILHTPRSSKTRTSLLDAV